MRGITKSYTIWCASCAKREHWSGFKNKKAFVSDRLDSGDWLRFMGEFYCKECITLEHLICPIQL